MSPKYLYQSGTGLTFISSGEILQIHNKASETTFLSLYKTLNIVFMTTKCNAVFFFH